MTEPSAGSGFCRSALRRLPLFTLLATIAVLLVPTTSQAWMDIDSPGEYTNDNTPLISGDAEINFYAGIVVSFTCNSVIYEATGVCIPIPLIYPTAGYTDVRLDLHRLDYGQHWCGGVCASYVNDQYVTTPTPSLPDLFAYSQPYSWIAPVLSDGEWRLKMEHYGEDAPSPNLSRNFFVDTRAPSSTTITSKPPAFDNDTTPTFDWTADDPSPSSGLDFECNLDGAGWADCPASTTFNTPEGNHTLQVKGIDKATNEDPAPASYSWMVDTTPPTATVTGLTNKQRFLLHDSITPATTCADPLSSGVRSGLKPSGAASATGAPECVSNAINNEDLGPHLFKVETEDRAGNKTTNEIAYVIDPPRYGDFVLHDHPTAYWRLNDPVGSSEMEDSSGHEHHGEYKNDVANGRDGAPNCTRRPHPPRVCELANDPENKAAFFPERDGYGFVNGISSSPSGYTMEAWVKPRSAGAMMVMSHGRAGQLFINSSGKLAFEQSQDTVGGAGPTLTPGQWWHVAASWDGSNTRLYVNGSQVAHSTTANKTPSGTSTFYVGYGEKAPWFHGEIDEAAFYDYALDAHRIRDRHKIGTAKDLPSLERGNSPLNTEGPFTDPVAPKNNGLYAPTKVPNAEFSCSDPDDLPGDSDIASCTATVDSHPIVNGTPLPDSLGTHVFEVTATDKGGNTYIHPHTYTVKSFKDIYKTDSPVAYYRLGEAADTTEMADASGNGHNGEYKNDTDSGPVGIAGDGDRARDFFGAGGYGYANGISAPTEQMTLEAWVKPDDRHRRQSIAGHGDGGELYLEGGHFKFRHGPQNRTVSAGVGPNPTGFTQVLGTWDGVDLRIYVDGILKGTTESNRGPTSASTFYVGYGEIAPWFDGTIDEVAYYSKALPPARVYQHFLADPPAEGTGGGSSGEGGGTTAPAGPTGSGPSDDIGPGDDTGDDETTDDDERDDDTGGGGGEPRDLMAAEFTSGPKLKRGKILATVACTGTPDCEGAAIAKVKVGKASKKAGTKRLQIASGESKTLRFELSRKLRRKAAVGKVRSVTVLLEAVGGRELGRGRG